ncbi:MAG: site-specific DNA-methyltransferase [Thermoproteota archaeon]
MTITLKQGDCLELMKELPDESIDLVLTDPPYSEEFIPLYEDLARESSRVLKDGRLCIAYAGHYHLPEVIELMGKHLKYYWIFALQHQGGGSTMIFEKRISCHFKPIIAYSKGKVNGKTPIISDVIKGSGRAKKNHPWEQGVNELYPFIKKYTKEGDTVLDLFMGSGTTGVACVQLNRNFIGYEINPEYVKIAEKRIDEAQKQMKL